MIKERKSGILLHPTSLPGPDGIGDLGPECYHWIDFLAESGCKLWQILPLGPTGYGDSPYQCFSAFAGNPYLISPVPLIELDILKHEDLSDRPVFPVDHVDFGPVIEWKIKLLDRAYARFKKSRSVKLISSYNIFCENNKGWLNDFSTFMAIKESLGGGSWDNWPDDLRNRVPKAIDAFSLSESERIEKHKFRQFLFFDQWSQVHTYANEKGIAIIGDIPIFVAYDSADAWSNPDLFYLGKDGRPTVVAGVPPDYFSPTGQLWGNPLYRWEYHGSTDYSWWKDRFRATLKQVDIIRLDHFRGFAGYWEVPAGLPTAEIGRWVKGPGAHFLKSMEKEFKGLPIIAEDLGVVTPDVTQLLEDFALPGMRVLQFAFSDPENPFLPHHYTVNCVAYTGTHDNDTSRGWYESAPVAEQDFCRRYLARSGEDIAWDLIRGVWSSNAGYAVSTLQDFLSLDTSARMNFPGKPSGNWSWRYRPGELTAELGERIREMNFLYSR